MLFRDLQWLIDIDDGMGHNYAAAADPEPAVFFAIEKAVEADKTFAQSGLDYLGAMGGDVVSFQA